MDNLLHDFYAIFSPNSIEFRVNHYSSSDDWFYTAPLHLIGGTTYRLLFDYRTNDAFNESLEVKWDTWRRHLPQRDLLYSPGRYPVRLRIPGQWSIYTGYIRKPLGLCPPVANFVIPAGKMGSS